MSFETRLAEDRRIILLRGLQEAGNHLNETMCKLAVQNFGHHVGRDVVRADLQWLSEQRLVRLEKMNAGRDSEFWVAHLTTEGDEVASGRVHTGVGKRLD